MPLASDITPDYALFDEGETVTLRQIRPQGVTVVSVENALGGADKTKALAALGGVALFGTEGTWSLDAAQCGELGVVPGDVIVDASGNAWSVLETDPATVETRIICAVRLEE
jgi:hypothetical protein